MNSEILHASIENIEEETERINNLVSNQTKEILQLKEEWYFNDSYKFPFAAHWKKKNP